MKFENGGDGYHTILIYQVLPLRQTDILKT